MRAHLALSLFTMSILACSSASSSPEAIDASDASDANATEETTDATHGAETGVDVGGLDARHDDVEVGDAGDVAVSDGGTTSRPLGFSPWILLDAEHGALGARYEGSASDQWSSADGATIVDDTHVFEGSKSFEMHVDKGTPGTGQFGTWGGIKELPAALHEGDVLHAQVAVFFPTTFDWTANPHLKFLRFHTATAAGANRGYHDIYIYNETIDPGHDGQLESIYEGDPIWKETTAVLQKGRWEVVEFEVTFDHVSAAAGGRGRVRAWQARAGKMQLVLDRTDTQTLVAADDIVDGFFLFTYWNSHDEDGMYPSKAENCWVDRIVLERDLSKLVERDEAGHPIIGGVE